MINILITWTWYRLVNLENRIIFLFRWAPKLFTPGGAPIRKQLWAQPSHTISKQLWFKQFCARTSFTRGVQRVVYTQGSPKEKTTHGTSIFRNKSKKVLQLWAQQTNDVQPDVYTANIYFREQYVQQLVKDTKLYNYIQIRLC